MTTVSNGYLLNRVPPIDSKYISEKLIYSDDDLVRVETNSCITYSYLTTQNLNILHAYCKKSIRK